MSLPTSPFIELANTDQGIYLKTAQARQLDQLIEAARAALDEKLGEQTALQQEHDALAQGSDDLRRKIALQEEFVSKLEAQVPLIRNEKEFVASKKQLEEGRRHKGQLEEQQLELDIQREDIQQQLSDLNSVIAEHRTEFEEQTSQLQQQRDEVEQELNELRAQQQQFKSQIPDRLQRFYDKFLQRGMSRPICAAHKSESSRKEAKHEWGCTGCNMVLPPQLINEMISLPENPKHCPHCQRLLFIPADALESEEEPQAADA